MIIRVEARHHLIHQTVKKNRLILKMFHKGYSDHWKLAIDCNDNDWIYIRVYVVRIYFRWQLLSFRCHSMDKKTFSLWTKKRKIFLAHCQQRLKAERRGTQISSTHLISFYFWLTESKMENCSHNFCFGVVNFAMEKIFSSSKKKQFT